MIEVKTSWKPTVAGILNIVVGVFTLFGVFFIALMLVGFGGGMLALSRVMDLMPMWLSGFVQFAMVIIAIILIVFSALPLLGGIYSIQRKNWPWALTGSIITILSSTIIGVVSTVLIALSRNEFEKYDSFR